MVTTVEVPGAEGPDTLLATTEKEYLVAGLSPSSVVDRAVGPTVSDGPVGSARTV